MKRAIDEQVGLFRALLPMVVGAETFLAAKEQSVALVFSELPRMVPLTYTYTTEAMNAEQQLRERLQASSEYGHGQNSRGEYGHSPRAWLHALPCAEFEGHAYHGYTRHGRHCRAPSSRGCCIPSSRRTSGSSSPWVGCSACGWASFRRSSSLEIVPPNESPDEALALGGYAVRRAMSTLMPRMHAHSEGTMRAAHFGSCRRIACVSSVCAVNGVRLLFFTFDTTHIQTHPTTRVYPVAKSFFLFVHSSYRSKSTLQCRRVFSALLE